LKAKAKKTSFKIWGSLCSARKLLAQSAVSVCVEVKVKGQGEGQTLAIFLELVSKLLCCAYASYFTENRGLLTEQALLLSKESLFRQQAFGPSIKMLDSLTIDTAITSAHPQSIQIYSILSAACWSRQELGRTRQLFHTSTNPDFSLAMD